VLRESRYLWIRNTGPLRHIGLSDLLSLEIVSLYLHADGGGTPPLDTWESFFREKSRRRAIRSSVRAVVRWSAAAIAFLCLTIAVLGGIDAAR
jgi:hypothetical protein